MAMIAVVGDGPAGLGAALFLAKNGHEVVVHGTDETAMHHAQLRNYLGVEEMAGTEFQLRARAQVEGFGADLRLEQVTEVARDGDGAFTVTTEEGGESNVDYVVLAAAKKGTELARQLGIESGASGVEVDEHQRAADRVYVVGRLARPDRSQAIISAGAGAVAALDILSREEGKDVTDWDTPDG